MIPSLTTILEELRLGGTTEHSYGLTLLVTFEPL